MSSVTPFLPPVLETVNELLTTNKIPALNSDEMGDLSDYLFRSADRTLRIQIAEIAYRNHDDPQALDIFLACTMPLAQKMSERKARRIYAYPSAWALEAMYDGAVTALLTMFQRHAPLSSVPDAFRRYLMRTLITGSVRDYFRRDENFKMNAVEDLAQVSSCKPLRNGIEQDVITRELLEQVTQYPNLPPFVRKTLKCIADLGPDAALKTHAFTKSGDSAKWTRARAGAPILDPIAVAKARGVSRLALHFQLWKARVVLRQVFNGDGKLFMSR